MNDLFISSDNRNVPTEDIHIIIDIETGVHYLVIVECRSIKSICPRYSTDGKLVVSSKEEIERAKQINRTSDGYIHI